MLTFLGLVRGTTAGVGPTPGPAHAHCWARPMTAGRKSSISDRVRFVILAFVPVRRHPKGATGSRGGRFAPAGIDRPGGPPLARSDGGPAWYVPEMRGDIRWEPAGDGLIALAEDLYGRAAYLIVSERDGSWEWSVYHEDDRRFGGPGPRDEGTAETVEEAKYAAARAAPEAIKQALAGR